MAKLKKYKPKKYLHFDSRRYFEDVESYVTNPDEIIKHSFFPLIHYTIDFETFNEDYIDKRDDKRPIKEKSRDIMYASHLDNIIYKYYGEMLNKYYNSWATSHSIDECSIAYRDNKLKKCNIDFAAEVINSIRKYDECFIMIGDFEKFFDRLDHTFLKERLMDVLNVKRLSDDWFKVFKSITKYSYVEKDLINAELGTDKEIKSRKQLKYFQTPKEFRDFRKRLNCVKENTNNYGIPQGSAISAVFANVYTTRIDRKLYSLATKYQGMYRRYSDDFILIIPKHIGDTTVSTNDFLEIKEKVYSYIDEEKLLIQKTKTQLYDYKDLKVQSLDGESDLKIDYLGFVFDGKTVEMRSKSPYKFYRKAYKQIDKAKKVKSKKLLKNIPYRRKIYRLYTDLGIQSGDFGNFITYARKSQSIFDSLSPDTNNLIMQQIKNRKRKIEKRIGFKINVKEK